MELSKAGAAFIASWEAIYLEAYDDGGGVWSIGAGHTDMAGPPLVRRGDIIPLSRAFMIFAADMPKYEAGVRRSITVPLKQHEFDALVSFHFNTGAIKTGSVDDRLNAGNTNAALATMARYTRDNGRVIAGLENRRRAEVALFRTGVYPPRKILIKDRRNSAGRLIDATQFVWR